MAVSRQIVNKKSAVDNSAWGYQNGVIFWRAFSLKWLRPRREKGSRALSSLRRALVSSQGADKKNSAAPPVNSRELVGGAVDSSDFSSRERLNPSWRVQPFLIHLLPDLLLCHSLCPLHHTAPRARIYNPFQRIHTSWHSLSVTNVVEVAVLHTPHSWTKDRFLKI